MAVTLKCRDCGHTTQAGDDTPQTCPQCEGTMKKSGNKADGGAASSGREKPRSRDEDDEPRPRKKSRFEDDEPKERLELKVDEDDEEGSKGKGKGKGRSGRNGAAAESLGLKSGFHDKSLMRQVEDELSRGEVLHWAARPSREIAQANGNRVALFGYLFAGLGLLISIGIFSSSAPWYVGLFPLLFVLIGIALAVLGPRSHMKQAERGWYAVTDRRAIVYSASVFGSGGKATTYEPSELRQMRVETTDVVEGGGDLIFRTEISRHTHTHTDARGRRTTSTSTSKQNYGFLGIEQVREVETLVVNVLLDGNMDEERERARKKRRRDREADRDV